LDSKIDEKVLRKKGLSLFIKFALSCTRYREEDDADFSSAILSVIDEIKTKRLYADCFGIENNAKAIAVGNHFRNHTSLFGSYSRCGVCNIGTTRFYG